MARLSYADEDDLPEEHRHLLESTLQDGKPLNIYRAFGNNPPVLAGLRGFLGALWEETGLTPYRRELVILTVAGEMDSQYEWHQHVRIAREAGVSDGEIRAISRGRFDGFDPGERALVSYARAVVRGAVDDERHDALCEHVDDATAVGTATLAGAYLMVARLLDAFAVETEEPFLGWDLETA